MYPESPNLNKNRCKRCPDLFYKYKYGIAFDANVDIKVDICISNKIALEIFVILAIYSIWPINQTSGQMYKRSDKI